MNDRKTTLLGFLGQIFMIYGITNILLNIFVLIFGRQAEGYSTIFSLGSGGVGTSTCFEFLAAVMLLTGLRLLLFSGRLPEKLPVPARIVLVFVSALVVITVFNAAFGWFPSDDAAAWAMFFVCFAVSCAASIGISALAERQQNRKLEKALARLKEEEKQ